MSTRNPLSPRSPDITLYSLTSRSLPSSHSFHDAMVDKPGQPSRPRPINPIRATTSPVNRPVRSAPASPSGRLYSGALAALSPISPIQLGTPLPVGQRDERMENGHGAAGPSRQKQVSGDNNARSTPILIPGINSPPKLTPFRQTTSPPQPMPRSSSYGNSLNYLPKPIHSLPTKTLASQLPTDPSSSSYHRTPSRPLIAKPRSRSRTLAPSAHSSGSDTETGVESDTTVRPGRIKGQSLSQPDLVALRNRLEGWVGDVAARQMEGKREKSGASASALGLGEPWAGPKDGSKSAEGHTRRSSSGRKTPPDRRQSAQAGRMSPRRTISGDISPLTPVSSISSRSANNSPRLRPVGGMTSSEDADDDFDGTDSPSSGSLSFSPKHRELRRRLPLKERTNEASGLGLVFTDEPASQPPDDKVDARQKEENLFSLRLLAVFPAVWGYLVLMQAVLTGGIWVNLYPWGIDTSREALDRVMMGWGMEGTWGSVPRGDLLLAAAWVRAISDERYLADNQAVLTGHYCFDMTTGLTHRWRVYYDLPATITRLLSIQCICWPLTGLTLWFLGPERILFAWVVIGCTTAGSRSVQMYVTSNILTATSGPGGDVTPRRKPSVPLPARGRSPWAHSLGPGGDKGQEDQKTEGSEGSGGWLEQFKTDRRWDWDMVAREVGWKLGVLLLLTNAWLFWGIETGRFK